MNWNGLSANSFWYDNHRILFNKDCRYMVDLPDESVQMIVTSPPYWGLRKYAGLPDLIWGGKEECQHQWGKELLIEKQGNWDTWEATDGKGKTRFSRVKAEGGSSQGSFCSLCGAWQGQLGLEPTPEMYISHLVQIFREVRRTLRKDGVVFLNIGDSYAQAKGRYTQHPQTIANFKERDEVYEGRVDLKHHPILKDKDLCLIPFRLAIALQEPYQEFTIKELADRAWMAGIIDGEGCIGIHHFEREDRGNHYHSFQPFISVGSIDLPLIERIVRITRMNGTRQRTEPGDMDGRGIITRHSNYEWRVEGDNAVKIIEDAFPNLTIKRKQAKIAYELKACHVPHTGKGHKVPPDITAYKLMLWQMIKDCNQRKDIEINLPDPTPHIEPGWWVRSVIIWNKPNPMPESVRDRPSESHEYILMLTKSARYYWDAEAVREKQLPQSIERMKRNHLTDYDPGYPTQGPQNLHYGEKLTDIEAEGLSGRNLRSVWTFPTQPYPEAHFATYPEKLVEICVKAATPEAGCCSKCGKPWARMIERNMGERHNTEPADLATDGEGANRGKHATPTETKTIGWKPQCKCEADKIPSTILDPFTGSGTTLKVAAELNRRAVGYELSEQYCKLAVERNKQGIIL